MLSRELKRRIQFNTHVYQVKQPFTVLPRLLEKPLPPRKVIPEDEIIESFLKGSGPGGQKINKTSSAVQLKHLPTGIVVKSQDTRSREQNRKTARKILGEKLDEIEKGDESRTAIKAERARTKKASASKKAKRKYKKLAEEGATTSAGDQTSVEGGHDVPSTSESRETSNQESDEVSKHTPQ